MATRYTDEFCRDAVRIAATSGLTRPQTAADLGVGLSTLNKWVQKPLGIRTKGRINEFRDRNVSATSPMLSSLEVVSEALFQANRAIRGMHQVPLTAPEKLSESHLRCLVQLPLANS